MIIKTLKMSARKRNC
ncbi:hypothetical protein V3601_000730 [Escherichia coli]